MRPSALNPLFASVTTLAGVGPRLEQLYAKLLDRPAPRILDLVFHLPTGAIDRRARPKLKDVVPGLSRAAVLWDSGNPSGVRNWNEKLAAAEVLGLQLLSLEVRTAEDFEGAFEECAR